MSLLSRWWKGNGSADRVREEPTHPNGATSLGEERDQLEAALAALGGAVLVLDRDERVIWASPVAGDFLGWKGRRVAGERLSEVARVSALLELVAEARRTDSETTRELTLYPQGRESVLLARAIPQKTSHETRLLVVMRDRTDERRLDRAREDFVVNASHELRTPLTAIKGYVETLVDGAAEDPALRERFLKQLTDNVNHLTALTEDLLDLSRLESTDGDLPRTSIDLRSVIDEAVDQLRALASERKIELNWHRPESKIVAVTNAEALGHILTNLLDNALKYTGPGGKIDVDLQPGEGVARISVRDTGIGIPRHDLERIFERFYRVDKARSREAGGTGLGLSIVKQLVNLLGGKVSVQSELDHGSSFTIFLPS